MTHISQQQSLCVKVTKLWRSILVSPQIGQVKSPVFLQEQLLESDFQAQTAHFINSCEETPPQVPAPAAAALLSGSLAALPNFPRPECETYLGNIIPVQSII